MGEMTSNNLVERHLRSQMVMQPFTAIEKNKKPNAAGKGPNYTKPNATERSINLPRWRFCQVPDITVEDFSFLHELYLFSESASICISSSATFIS